MSMGFLYYEQSAPGYAYAPNRTHENLGGLGALPSDPWGIYGSRLGCGGCAPPGGVGEIIYDPPALGGLGQAFGTAGDVIGDTGFDIGKTIGKAVSAGLQSGASFLMMREQARIQADALKSQAKAADDAARAAQARAMAAQAEADKAFALARMRAGQGTNWPLYIGLGVGGIALLGIIGYVAFG